MSKVNVRTRTMVTLGLSEHERVDAGDRLVIVSRATTQLVVVEDASPGGVDDGDGSGDGGGDDGDGSGDGGGEGDKDGDATPQ